MTDRSEEKYTPPMIWSSEVSFFNPSATNAEHPEGQKDTLAYHYYASEDSEEAQLDKLKARFDKYIEQKGISPTDIRYSVKAIGRFRWWLTWFSHETDQKFSSAEEAMRDFNLFCDEQRFEDYKYCRYDIEEMKKFCWCPMGAEDYYRREVCECEHCKKDGVWRIKH